MEFTIVADNVAEVIAKTNSAIELSMEAVSQAMGQFADEEIQKAIYDTPPSPNYVRTGDLQRSISNSSDKNKACVGTNLQYAPYNELGTSKMAARPFIKPAVENHQDEYKELIMRTLKSSLG